MPDTGGYGPWGTFEQGGAIDNSGGGADPSYAMSLAPGGHFAGEDANYLGYRQGVDNGGAAGNPDYQLPSWLTSLLGGTRAGSLLARHESNVRSPGSGQEPSGPGGYPYQGWSGPGAAYGAGGNSPTRGLLDFGRPPGEAWDGPELRPPGGGETKPGKGKGKGGSQAGHFTFSPYGGIQQHAQFVDWQPTAFGEQPKGATRFVGGSGSSTPGGPVAPPAGTRGNGGNGGKGPGGGSGPGGGQGRGGGQGPGPGGPGARPGAGNGQGGKPGQTALDPAIPFRLQNDRTPFNSSTYGGVDTNNLDYRTPGWLRDPTTSVMYTSGFPNATPHAPTSGWDPNVVGKSPIQGFDSYVTALHDAGYANDDIMSLVGPYGYRQDDNGSWNWGWGTGPVVSNGENGGDYSFANGSGPGQAGGSDFSPGPFWAGGSYQHETDNHGPAGGPSLLGNLNRTGNAQGVSSAGGTAATDRTMQGTNDLVGGAAFFHGSDI